MAKKNINIKVKADSKEAESGINKLTSQLNKLSKNQALGGLNKLTIAAHGVSKAFGVITDTIKGTVQKLKEFEEVYKIQAKAEVQLEQAAKHNPYFSGDSTKNLKEYASYLQSISTTGDEVLIPMMAELAAAGRTEIEIQQIMKAAVDASASGAVSLESAVTALNASYGGSVGQLGKILPSLKNLTKEELSNGKAVEEVAKAYEGMSEAVTTAVGSLEQMQAAKGDFEEALGKITKPTSDNWNKFWKNVYEKGVDVVNRFNDYLEKKWSDSNNSQLLKQFDEVTKNTSNEIDNLAIVQDALKKLTDEERQSLLDYIVDLEKNGKKLNLTQQQIVSTVNRWIESEKQINEVKKSNSEYQAKLDRQNEEYQKKVDERNKLREQYDEKIEKVKTQITQRRILGEVISEEEEAQLLLNTATQAYIDMMSDPAFRGNSGSYEHEEAARKQIEDWAKTVNLADDLKKKLEEISNLSEADTIEQLKENLASIDEIMLNMDRDLSDEEIKLWEAYANERMEIEDKIAEYQKQKNEETKEFIKESLYSLADSFQQLNSLILTNIDTIAKNETAKLDRQYKDGILSYEDYCDKKSEIERQASLETYRVNLANWAMSLATATANIAEGITKAYAQGGTAGLITGALVAAAGGVEIGTLIANKPIRPSFGHGGIVPGNSYSGDHVGINANSAEMVLTQQQQLALWKMANSGGNAGGLQQQIIVQNTISDRARADIDTTNGNLKITIREYLKEEMASGAFDSEINSASVRAQGERYL